MNTLLARLVSATALLAVLSGCATVPGDAYYDTPAYPANSTTPRYPVYEQPYYNAPPVYSAPPVYVAPPVYRTPPTVIYPYPVAPPPVYHQGDRDRRPDWNRGRDRDDWRDRDRADRDRADRDRAYRDQANRDRIDRDRADRDRRERDARDAGRREQADRDRASRGPRPGDSVYSTRPTHPPGDRRIQWSLPNGEPGSGP